VNNIGVLLLTKYLLPFEAASLLLLGALIGAAVLSREGT
jgi:NADH-quinone oxidoreductase subunit J